MRNLIKMRYPTVLMRNLNDQSEKLCEQNENLNILNEKLNEQNGNLTIKMKKCQ